MNDLKCSAENVLGFAIFFLEYGLSFADKLTKRACAGKMKGSRRSA